MPTTSGNLPNARSPRTLPWFLLIAANILWASSYVAAKFALRETSLVFMLALRMILAAVLLLPLLWVQRRALKLRRRDLWQLGLLALIGFVVNKIFEFGGLSLTTASDVALLISSESIFTALFCWLFLRERFKKVTLCALLLGFVGVYLIIERSLIPALPVGGGAWRILGDLMVVLSLCFEALYTTRGKAMLVKHSPLLVCAASIVGSTIFWLPAAAWEMQTPHWHAPGFAGWLSIAWLAIASTVVAYLAWFKGLEKVDGSAAASTLFIQPLLGTVLAILLLDDQLTPMTIVGGLLIVVSVYGITRYG
ncbi:MAG: DMT family transporter [Ktedonobacteraceae bacterium]|nr:DMT family transporter [Ktedonobacteraceae bacterium]